jgi:hypothetical protein
MTKKSAKKTVPLPADGRLCEPNGKVYVTTAVACSMGFKAPFLDRYHRIKHPAINKRIGHFKRWVYVEDARGARARKLAFHLLDDLNRLLQLRKRAHSFSESEEKWPTVKEAALRLGVGEEAIRTRVRDGRVRKVIDHLPRIARANFYGRPHVFTKFVPITRVCPEDLNNWSGSAELISLAEAARKSGIKWSIWREWARRFCQPLGRKLFTRKQAHPRTTGAGLPMQCISREEYTAVVCAIENAKAGRFDHGDEVFLSPSQVGKEFKLPEHRESTAKYLGRYRRRDCKTLGHPIRSAEGVYLDSAGRILRGVFYCEADLQKLFKRIRPAPPRPIAPAARIKPSPVAAPSESVGGRPTIWRHDERCYSLDGATVYKVSNSEELALNTFLESGEALETGDFPTGLSNVALTIRLLRTKFGGAFADAIGTPGGKKGTGGYRARVRPLSERKI